MITIIKCLHRITLVILFNVQHPQGAQAGYGAVTARLPQAGKLIRTSKPPAAPSCRLPTDLGLLAWLMPLGGLAALLLRRLRQPNPWMLGPLMACAGAGVLLDINIALPTGASDVGQWLIGSALGCHFDRAFFRKAPAFLLRVLLFTLLAMLVAAGAATLLSTLGDVDRVSLMLGMMPGGITELCLTAEALQLSVAIVTALQVLRLFLVMFLAEPLFVLWQRFSPER